MVLTGGHYDDKRCRDGRDASQATDDGVLVAVAHVAVLVKQKASGDFVTIDKSHDASDQEQDGEQVADDDGQHLEHQPRQEQLPVVFVASGPEQPVSGGHDEANDESHRCGDDSSLRVLFAEGTERQAVEVYPYKSMSQVSSG